MSETTLQQLLAEAAVHQQAGRLSETERLCRLVLSQSPNDADALSAAVALGGVAIGIGPQAPDAPHRLPGPALLGRSLEALTKILACANARRSCPEALSAID